MTTFNACRFFVSDESSAGCYQQLHTQSGSSVLIVVVIIIVVVVACHDHGRIEEIRDNKVGQGH